MTELEPAVTYLPRGPRPLRRRAVLHVGAEQLAALLRLPNDVDVVAFGLDPVRDAVSFVLQSDRFGEVLECAHPPALVADVAVETCDDGVVIQYVSWPGLGGAGYSVRHEAPEDDEPEPEVDRGEAT